MAKMNYDAINFKNKDVDKFSTKFNKQQGDPKNKNTQATADSTEFFKKEENIAKQLAAKSKTDSSYDRQSKLFWENKANEAISAQVRQSHKGKPGYDKDGHPNKPMTGMQYLQKLYPNK